MQFTFFRIITLQQVVKIPFQLSQENFQPVITTTQTQAMLQHVKQGWDPTAWNNRFAVSAHLTTDVKP